MDSEQTITFIGADENNYISFDKIVSIFEDKGPNHNHKIVFEGGRSRDINNYELIQLLILMRDGLADYPDNIVFESPDIKKQFNTENHPLFNREFNIEDTRDGRIL